MDRITVLIADDHALFREGLCMLLAQEPSISVVGAADCNEAISMVEALQPDILLLAVNTPQPNALDLLPLVSEKSSRTRVLILFGFSDDRFMSRALQLGAKGYVLKTLNRNDFVKAIRAIHVGENWAGRKVLADVLESLYQKTHQMNRSLSEKQEALTDREQDVVKWVIQGMTNKEIASRLDISDKTVKAHLSHIFSKVKVNRRLQLALHQIVEHLE
jgi:two-component system response regulator DegU